MVLLEFVMTVLVFGPFLFCLWGTKTNKTQEDRNFNLGVILAVIPYLVLYVYIYYL